MARAWRPSHLNQRGSGSACRRRGVSIRSAPGGLPTRPTGWSDGRWLRCERSEPRNHLPKNARFRGSGLAALAPQPAPGVAVACRRAGSRYGRPRGAFLLDLRGGASVVEVRAQRASKPFSPHARFRGSGLAALAPQPAPGVAVACRRTGSRYGRPWGGLPTRPTGWWRWLKCERSEPRNHLRRTRGFVARAWRPSHLNQRRSGCACRVAGSRYGRPWGAFLLDLRGGPMVGG